MHGYTYHATLRRQDAMPPPLIPPSITAFDCHLSPPFSLRHYAIDLIFDCRFSCYALLAPCRAPGARHAAPMRMALLPRHTRVDAMLPLCVVIQARGALALCAAQRACVRTCAV